MKYIIGILCAIILVAGCTSQAQDKTSMQDIFVQLQENPDQALAQCDKLITEDAQQACYGTYMSIQAERQEPIDQSVCPKLTDPQVKEGCELYVQLQNK